VIRVVPVALLVAALFVAARPAAADSPETTFCGRIAAFTPATATADGSITVGSRTFVLRADAIYSAVGQNRLNLVVANSVCLTGARDAAGAFTQYLGNPMPSAYCGTVTSFTPATASTDGSVEIRDVGVVRFAIVRGTDVGSDPTGKPRTCFRLALDARGDAVVTARILPVPERTVQRVAGVCGLMSAWTVPERTPGLAQLIHNTAGAITVGTHTYAIAAGTIYSLVNAAPVLGQPTCLSGSLDASGTLIEYGAQPGLPACMSGTIAEYRPPTATAAGLIRFGVSGSAVPYTDDSYRFVIPAGTRIPADATSGGYCFTLALGPGGNAIVTGATIPAPDRLAGPVNTLPNTSTLP
jgi:hypothetical protein